MTIWPSLIYIALSFLGVGSKISKDSYDFPGLVCDIGIFALLWWGGFFDALIGKF
jgi:hypothetical protein